MAKNKKKKHKNRKYRSDNLISFVQIEQTKPIDPVFEETYKSESTPNTPREPGMSESDPIGQHTVVIKKIMSDAPDVFEKISDLPEGIVKLVSYFSALPVILFLCSFDSFRSFAKINILFLIIAILFFFICWFCLWFIILFGIRILPHLFLILSESFLSFGRKTIDFLFNRTPRTKAHELPIHLKELPEKISTYEKDDV